jgi:hypothetical protein
VRFQCQIHHLGPPIVTTIERERSECGPDGETSACDSLGRCPQKVIHSGGEGHLSLTVSVRAARGDAATCIEPQ